MKRFTEARRLLRLAALLLLAQGCASLPGAPDAAPTGADDAVRAEAGLPATEAGADAVATQPAPPVRDGNDTLFARATALLRDGQLEGAEALLLEITGSQPELAGPWINLARVYVAMKRPDDARTALGNALQANPLNCAAHNQMGVLSRRSGDFAAAESHYLACLNTQPRYRDAYLNLGILYELYLGRLPEALDAYQRYQSLIDEPDRRVKGWVMDLQRRLGG